MIKTSLPTISTKEKGFSLIEMMVVLVIIVLISVVVMPSVSSYFQLSLNSASRDLATTIKEAFNSTLVTGRVFRLAYDLKEDTFWVESGPVDALLETKESKEKEERRKRYSKSNEAPPSQFTLDKTVTRKKMALPRGVVFEDIVTQQSPEPLTEGIAYTHFFPHGVTEQTIIHIKDKSTHHASLVVTPLLGTTELYDRYVNGAEVFEK